MLSFTPAKEIYFMIYGLINITTKYQNPEYQKNMIRERYPDAILDDQNDYTTLLSICKERDTVIIQNIIRLCDTDVTEDNLEFAFKEIHERYQKIFNKGADIVILEQPYLNSQIYKEAIISYNDIKGNAAGAVSQVLQEQIFLAVKHYTETKTDIKNSIKSKKRTFPTNKGKRMITAKEKASKIYIRDNLVDFGGTMTNKEVMTALGLARNTFYKYKKQILLEDNPEKIVKKERNCNIRKDKDRKLKYGEQTSITDFI